MYQADPDPYCYANSPVLKNKAGLTTHALERFETAMTFARAEEPLPTGRLSATHYRAIHHHLFQDVYAWAGKDRTVRLSKGDSAFCYPEYIAVEMKRVFGWLKEHRNLQGLSASGFAADAAHLLADLNAIHPFREGNGRTQLTFATLLADRAGHPIKLGKLNPEDTLAAMIESFQGDEKPLVALLKRLIA